MKLTKKQEIIFEWQNELDTYVEIQENKRKSILKKFTGFQKSQSMMRCNAVYVKSLCEEIIYIDERITECCKIINLLEKKLRLTKSCRRLHWKD